MLVRHGRTAWNAEGRFQGWADPPLDDLGRRQATECGAELARELAGTDLVQVVSSDRIRAFDTARAVASALGLPLDVDAELREVDVGAWEGLTRAEVEARFPDEYRRWSAGDDIARGGGETLAAAGRRVAACLERRAVEGGLVVVGHGLSLQAAVGALRSRGLIHWEGAPPHLGNGRHLTLPLIGAATASLLPTDAPGSPRTADCSP